MEGIDFLKKQCYGAVWTQCHLDLLEHRGLLYECSQQLSVLESLATVDQFSFTSVPVWPESVSLKLPIYAQDDICLKGKWKEMSCLVCLGNLALEYPAGFIVQSSHHSQGQIYISKAAMRRCHRPPSAAKTTETGSVWTDSPSDIDQKEEAGGSIENPSICSGRTCRKTHGQDLNSKRSCCKLVVLPGVPPYRPLLV